MGDSSISEIYAHSRDCLAQSEWQTLEEHLRGVSAKAAGFASEFGYKKWGAAIGILHDAGKVSGAFQRRLKGSSERVDHSSLGASIALGIYEGRLADTNGRLMAFAIAGHHGGMPNGVREGGGGRRSLASRLRIREEDSLGAFERFLEQKGIAMVPSDGLEPLALERLALQGNDYDLEQGILSCSVIARMLFSCLVDADYLDTEAFMTPDVAEARTSRHASSVGELARALDAHVDSLAEGAPPSPVNAMRQKVLRDCRAAASWEPGIYTLTVPTGGGKTLSSASFALRHALTNTMKRVIYAIPFTSIVEQSAEVFRGIFGAENVLEHHSNYDFESIGDEERRLGERLAVQNWDAPFIVTTNVQLLESLFSNKPGKCRKLHNIANSVIVLDEAQTLPDSLLRPTLAMLEELAIDFNVTVVLCTATQPALQGLWPFGHAPREIISCPDELARAFGHRASFVVRGSLTEHSLAKELISEKQALCIVGTKRKARVIYEDMTCELGLDTSCGGQESEIYHLSTNMTPLHRSDTIARIRHRLERGERCIVVSTQLIEAGVDIDFPVVYRELAGVDSMIQAAGRCNREGRLQEGLVHVFELSDERELGLTMQRRSLGWLDQMKELARLIIRRHNGTLDASMSGEFFSERYALLGDSGLDDDGIYGDMTSVEHLSTAHPFSTLDFEDYARRYRIIDDDSVPVFVPWGEKGISLMAELRESVKRGVPPAACAAKLQSSSVGIRPHRLRELERQGAIDSKTYEPISVLFLEHDCRKLYDNSLGLLELGEGAPVNLIV